MQLHNRHHKVSVATTKFGLAWVRTQEAGELKTYGDASYVLHQVDAFWIDAFRKELPMATAISEWASFDPSSVDFGATIKATGDLLVNLIQENELTYGEINSILIHSRSTDARYLLRAERGLDEPDHSNGPG